MPRVTLPIGTSDFAEIRREGWYYVDKTGLIGDLLNTRKAKVTLITRPRHCARSKRGSTQKISGMNMTRSCAMVLRFIKSGASSNENQTENNT